MTKRTLAHHQATFIRRSIASVLFVVTLGVFSPGAHAAETWPTCQRSTAWDPSAQSSQEINLCISRDGWYWRGGVGYVSGGYSVGAVSIWYAANGNCNEAAKLLQHSDVGTLSSAHRTITTGLGYNASYGTYCVVYRHQDPFDVWFNQVAVFNDKMQPLGVYTNPDRN
ncbi:MAG: hypothetical protein JWN04_3714 [Myxococcaceae bacterium]|nr:hypothetical protein [Myxococcaceae bacterium]